MREVAAKCESWRGPRLVKVVDPFTLAKGRYPLQRCVLDARYSDQQLEHLAGLPLAGILTTDAARGEHQPPHIVIDTEADIRSGDVMEIQASRRRAAIVYRPGDVGNVLFTTERCNNFCLMCSQPPRDIDDSYRTKLLLDLVELIEPEEACLGISGGEPTLLGVKLLEILRHCATKLPQTHLQVLTNGRRFAQPAFAEQFRNIHPSLIWAVPLYGDTYRLHDYVVQASGAFADTIRGLYALHEAGQRIEIRVVLVRPSIERLPAIARYIHRNFPFAEHVALMGTEPIGFAKAHYESLWMDPVDAAPYLTEAVDTLAGHGITVSLYNLPLCVLPASLRRYARRSISDWKQEYLPACEGCAARSRCGGFFQWITPEWTSRAIAPMVEGNDDA